MGEALRRSELGFSPRGINSNQPQQIQVDLKNAIPKVCGKCNCEYFIPVIKLYTISALVSPTGQELTAQQPVLVCHNCGELVA